MTNAQDREVTITPSPNGVDYFRVVNYADGRRIKYRLNEDFIQTDVVEVFIPFR
jgi:hypothetical protein